MNDALKVLERVFGLAKVAGDVLEYRKLLTEAVARGDLDLPVASYEATADSVNDFINGGD